MRSAEDLFDWRRALRDARLARTLSLSALSRNSGLSLAAVKAYEAGTRTPSRDALTALIDAIGIPREDANRIYAGAGYAIDWYTLFRGRYLFDLDDARQQLESLQWPAFISNQSFDVVHANAAIRKLLEVDDGEPPGDDVATRNIFAGATLARFAARMENFDELVTFMIGLAKGDPRRPQDLDHPSPWLRESTQRVMRADDAVVRKYRELWENAAPVEHKMTHQYRVCWRHGSGRRLEFVGLLTIADIWNELSRNDWIPADNASWDALREIAG
jgi:transcriptional regulator with XRE-family HTH domain